MKSTWFGNKQRYEFAKLIQEADYSMHGWDLYNSWLQVASGSMRQACHVMRTGVKDDRIEQTVIDHQKRVKHPENFARAMGVLVAALEKESDDFLGSVLMEWGQNDVQFKGQCFTPMSVCRMMATMTIGDRKPDPDERLMISEPACGGGAMVIATSDVLKANGFFPWNYHWQCVDVDWRMFAACYIQTTLLGIPAEVVHGNTLSQERWDTAETISAVLYPLRKRPSVRIDEPVQEKIVTESLGLGDYKQLTLF
jgi:type I restriction-modification system DNA methylase subunit